MRCEKQVVAGLSFGIVLFIVLCLYPAKTSASPVTSTIESGDLRVTLDEGYPQVIDYLLTADNSVIDGRGPYSSTTYEIAINDVNYTPSVTFNKTSASTAQYTVTVNNVDLDGSGVLPPRTVTITYTYAVTGTTLTKNITSVTGDDAGAPFKVQLLYPIMSVNDGSMVVPGVAVSSVGGVQSPTLGYSYAQASDFYGTLQELYDAYMVYNSDLFLNGHSIEQAAYAFVWNDDAVGSVYTPSSFDRPYTMKLRKNGSVKIADIYDGAYHHRLSDGHRPQKEIALDTFTDVWYESRIHIAKDTNDNGQVDWQDGALWIKGQIPQMPTELREFFNGGNWSQTLGATPGRVGGSATAKSATVVVTQLNQLREIQRQTNHMTDGIGKQSYEYVGWNGRGHDYGWPSISEIYYNPALGTDAYMAGIKNDMAVNGGDLSFHVNMTDMTTNSNAYMRASAASPYGNRDTATTNLQYTTAVFGWDAYQNSHYSDVSAGYAFNRQDAFVDRFWAPLVLYQDVMIDYPKGSYGRVEERYAKAREIEHWARLGTYAATEYYDAEKRLNGGYIFKLDVKSAVIDSFINGGQTVLQATRNYQIQPKDYLWGTLYSDNTRTGNIHLSGDKNQTAVGLTKMTFLYSLLNGYLAQQGLQEYGDESTRIYTRWGDDTIYEMDKATNRIKVTDGDVTLAIGEDRFLPAIDGTDRIFVYSVEGNSNDWKLPAAWTVYDSLNLYELTSDGRKFVRTVKVKSDDTVTIATEPLKGYVLTPPDVVRDIVNGLNLSLSADISASSNGEEGYNDTNKAYTGMEYRYIPSAGAPGGDWTTVLKDMTSNMIDGSGTIRYDALVLAAFSADGDPDTYWTPNSDSTREMVDLADGHAWVVYDLGSHREVNRFRIQETSAVGDKITAFEIQYNNNGHWGTLHSGTTVPSGDIRTEGVYTDRIRLVITGAQSYKPRVAEVEIYGPNVYENDFNDNEDVNLQLIGASSASVTVTGGEVHADNVTGDTYIVNSPVAAKNGTYTFRMKPSSTGNAGALIRYVSAAEHTWVGFETNGLMRIRVTNSAVTPWAELSMMRTPLSAGSWHTVKIVYEDNFISVSVDGEDYYTGTLPGSGLPALEGQTGFVLWSTTSAEFDDVRQRDDAAIVRYADDYSDGEAANLQIMNNPNAALAVSGGAVNLTGSNGDILAIDNDSIKAKDGRYSMRMKLGSNARAGAVIRYVSNDTFTWIGFESDGHMRIREVIDGQLSEHYLTRSPLTANDWHTLDITYVDKHIRIVVDGQSYYDGLLPSTLPAVAGRTGFVGWYITDAWFDDISQQDDPIERLYAEDFAANNVSELRIANNSSAAVTASSGQVNVTGVAGDAFVVNEESIATRDGVYSFRMKPGTNARSGALIRYVSNETYTWIGFEPGGYFRIRVANGNTSSWSEVAFQSVALSPNDWHDINIHYRGQHIVVTVDGVEYFNGLLSGSHPAHIGKNGFVVWSTADAWFDDHYQSDTPQI